LPVDFIEPAGSICYNFFMDNTLNYYNQNSKSYFETTKNIIISEQIERFLSFIERKNELIADIGCGSGNSLKYIIEKEYTAMGADYSDELIALAKNYTGAEIVNLNIEDAAAVNKFIINYNIKHLFASASLLHMAKASFINFFDKIQFGGVFFFSLKEGEGEAVDGAGRFFSYYTRGEIERILNKRFTVMDFIKNEDKLGRGNHWISFIIKLNGRRRG